MAVGPAVRTQEQNWAAAGFGFRVELWGPALPELHSVNLFTRLRCRKRPRSALNCLAVEILSNSVQ